MVRAEASSRGEPRVAENDIEPDPDLDLTKIHKPSYTRDGDHKVFVQSLIEAACHGGPIIEIGVWHGDSTRCILDVFDALNKPLHLVSVDPSPLAENHWMRAVRHHRKTYNLRFILDKSLKASEKISVDPVWIYIDGCHCYECARADMDTWGPRVQDGGFMVFHDTDPVYTYDKRTPPHNHNGVRRIFGANAALLTSKVIRERFELYSCYEDGTYPGHRIYRTR